MSGSVIDFRSASARRVSHLRTEPREAFEPRETRRQRASRKRNPLRHPCHHVHTAVTIAGKLHRGEPLNDFIDEIAWLRRAPWPHVYSPTRLMAWSNGWR